MLKYMGIISAFALSRRMLRPRSLAIGSKFFSLLLLHEPISQIVLFYLPYANFIAIFAYIVSYL